MLSIWFFYKQLFNLRLTVLELTYLGWQKQKVLKLQITKQQKAKSEHAHFPATDSVRTTTHCICWDSEVCNQWKLCYPIKPRETMSEDVQKAEKQTKNQAAYSKYKSYKKICCCGYLWNIWVQRLMLTWQIYCCIGMVLTHSIHNSISIHKLFYWLLSTVAWAITWEMIHFSKLYCFYQDQSDVHSCLFHAITSSKEKQIISSHAAWN